MSSTQVVRYVVDRSQSRLAFRVRLLGWKSRGEFTDFDGTVDYDPARPNTMRAEMTVRAASINTRIADRDKHLRTPDFFGVDEFPVLRFEGAEARESGAGTLRLEGMLTIRNVSRALVLHVSELRAVRDAAGRDVLSFAARGQLNRMDFGVGGRSLLDRSAFMVGREVELNLKIQAIC